MSKIKITLLQIGNHRYICSSNFFNCLFDGKTKKEITKLYPNRSNGAYYLDKFSNYLRDKYNKTIEEYIEMFFDFEWPKCPETKSNLGKRISGIGIRLSNYRKGGINKSNCPAFAEGCKKLSEDRVGEGNPMFGEKPWNLGLTAETNESMARIVESMKTRIISDETREKMRQASLGNIRHTTPHTKESIEKMRMATARRWSEGAFNRKTGIEQKVEDFLIDLRIPHEVQWQLGHFAIDVALPEYKIAIECQGQYFHCDPRFYPNGAINAMQKRNLARDKVKHREIDDLGWTLIELWEKEINNGEFKEILRCKLQELKVLNQLESETL